MNFNSKSFSRIFLYLHLLACGVLISDGSAQQFNAGGTKPQGASFGDQARMSYQIKDPTQMASPATEVPSLVDPDQFRKKPTEEPAMKTPSEKWAEAEKAKKQAQSSLNATQKKSATEKISDEENAILKLMPVPNLHGGISPYSMQRSTYNRMDLPDPNQTYGAVAWLAPENRGTSGLTKTWRSPNLAHNPLYFEEPNVERCGNNYGAVQPFVSGLHFFSNVALLPYKTGVRNPRDCEYGLGQCRPGDCNPAYRQSLERSGKGLIREGLVLGALIAL